MTPWTAAGQASLSFTISWSLPNLTSIESMIPFNHLILCRPLLLLPSIFPSIRVFSSDLALYSQSIAASALASVFPMNIQGWFPLGLIVMAFHYTVLSFSQHFNLPRALCLTSFHCSPAFPYCAQTGPVWGMLLSFPVQDSG